jgi:hypothetical protein
MRARSALRLRRALAGCALKAPPRARGLAQQALPNFKVPERWAQCGQPAPGRDATAGSPASTTRSSTRWCARRSPQPDLQVARARVEQAPATSRSPARRSIRR